MKNGDDTAVMWGGKTAPVWMSRLWRDKGLEITHLRGAGFYQWCNSDSEANYRPEGNRYRPDDFGYQLNARGFRCDEFGDAALAPRAPGEPWRLLFLGCSNTFGVGLPLEQVWAHNLWTRAVSASGARYWNVSMGGASARWIARMATLAVARLRPDVVVTLLPHSQRMEFADACGLHPWLRSHPPALLARGSANALSDLATPEEGFMEMVRALALLAASCAAFGSDLLWDCWDRYAFQGERSLALVPLPVAESWRDFGFSQPLSFRNARDRIHSGWETHARCADTVLPHLLARLRSRAP